MHASRAQKTQKSNLLKTRENKAELQRQKQNHRKQNHSKSLCTSKIEVENNSKMKCTATKSKTKTEKQNLSSNQNHENKISWSSNTRITKSRSEKETNRHQTCKSKPERRVAKAQIYQPARILARVRGPSQTVPSSVDNKTKQAWSQEKA